MLLKERQISIKIRKLEALLRRLPKGHKYYPEIESELGKSIAGYRGEQSMDYYFSYLMGKEYYILHDLRIFDQQHYFQIDTLLICPYFILIVEVKNFAGSLFFDHSFKQLIRTHNGKEEAFQSPLIQAKSHQGKLMNWLKVNKLPNVPVDYLVVISNPHTIIRTSPNYKEALQKVTTSPNFLNMMGTIESKFKTEKIGAKEIKKITKMLLSKHTEGNPDILKQFRINKEELITGIHCPSCFSIPMVRKEAKWFCSNCKIYSPNAYISSLEDYFLLVDVTITNQQLRNFLHISSRNISTKLLIALNLPYSGKGKARKYTLSLEILKNDF
jgi:hypothetical protein